MYAFVSPSCAKFVFTITILKEISAVEEASGKVLYFLVTKGPQNEV